MRALLLCAAAWTCSAAQPLVPFTITEPAGVPRRLALIEQGVPLPPLPEEQARRLVVLDAAGHPARAAIEIDGRDPLGRVRWVRVSVATPLRARERRTYQLATADEPPAPPALDASESGEGIVIRHDNYELRFAGRDRITLTSAGRTLLDGPLRLFLYTDARSIINAGGRTTVLSPFKPASFRLHRPSSSRAEVVLAGRYPKQKAYNATPGNNEPVAGFDVEVRFHLTALSPVIHFDWRIVNQAGRKAWLERYALALPVPRGTAARSTGKEWTELTAGPARLGVTAPFAADFGPGMGLRLTPDGLLHGGIDVPPDGSVGGAVPEIHRQFHHGMARTFMGTLVPGGGARETLHMPDLRLPAQHYSDVGVLPEDGDPVTPGPYRTQVARSAEWLLRAQWRGTLWAGEWWREWDLTRRQGAEEASNGNSLLAPLYHYWRTGDRRFLDCAARSFWFTVDVQHTRRRNGFGPMLHTRRHLLDELDWVHPRYQRVAGPLLFSHVALRERERRDIIGTVRHFARQIQDDAGVPHNWDEAANRRTPGETGVDTTNFVEALTMAWEETGDAFFLDRARRYARWAIGKWESRTDDTFWNWNLTRYVLTGLLRLVRAHRAYPGTVPDGDVVERGALAISRHTLTRPDLAHVPGTLGGGELHYVFYHAWLAPAFSRWGGDLAPLRRTLDPQLARQHANGTYPMNMGSLWSQYPNQVISYYDPKSIVAYLPVLAARNAAAGRGGSLSSAR